MTSLLINRRNTLKLGGAFAAASALSPAFAQMDRRPVLIACSSIATLDPAHSRSSGGNLSVLSQTLSSLTTIDANGEVIGDLATDWEVNSATEFTFHLNPAAQFENGAALNAPVVAWNFERMADPEVNATANTDFGLIESVEAIDDHTLVIRTNEPWLELPRRLSWMFMLEPEWTASHNPRVEVNASGAYRLVSYEPGADIVLEANPGFYGAAPSIERVIYRGIGTAATRISGIQGGEIDATLYIDPVDLAQLENVPGYTVGAKPGQRYHVLKFNFDNPALADIRVRQAINYGIDKEAITQAVFRGHVGAGSTQVLNDQTEGYNPDYGPWPYDPERARELLAEAGYGDGLNLTLKTSPEGTSVSVSPLVQVIAAQLGEIGINVDVTLLPYSAFVALRTQPEEAPDLTYAGFVSQSNSPRELFGQYGSQGPYSWGEMPPAFDNAIDSIRTAMDQESYIELVHTASRTMLDDALVTFLWTQPQSFAISERIEWQARTDDWVRATEMRWR